MTTEPTDSPMLAPEREFRVLEVGVGEQHLLQDLDRGLSDWHASKPGAMQHAREAAAAIKAPVREVTRASFEARVRALPVAPGPQSANASILFRHEAAAIAAEADAQLAALREAAQGLRVAGQALYNRATADTMAAWRTALADFDRVAHNVEANARRQASR